MYPLTPCSRGVYRFVTPSECIWTLHGVLTIPIGTVCQCARLSGPSVRCALPAHHSPLLSAAVCNALWAIISRHDRHTCKCKWRLRIEPKLCAIEEEPQHNNFVLEMHSCSTSLKHSKNASQASVCNAAIKVSVLHALKDPLGYEE